MWLSKAGGLRERERAGAGCNKGPQFWCFFTPASDELRLFESESKAELTLLSWPGRRRVCRLKISGNNEGQCTEDRLREFPQRLCLLCLDFPTRGRAFKTLSPLGTGDGRAHLASYKSSTHLETRAEKIANVETKVCVILPVIRCAGVAQVLRCSSRLIGLCAKTRTHFQRVTSAVFQLTFMQVYEPHAFVLLFDLLTFAYRCAMRLLYHCTFMGFYSCTPRPRLEHLFMTLKVNVRSKVWVADCYYIMLYYIILWYFISFSSGFYTIITVCVSYTFLFQLVLLEHHQVLIWLRWKNHILLFTWAQGNSW